MLVFCTETVGHCGSSTTLPNVAISVLYAKVEAQCDKLDMVELNWHHLRCNGQHTHISVFSKWLTTCLQQRWNLMFTVVRSNVVLRSFNSLFSRTTWISRYQKGRTSLDWNEARDDGVWRCIGISWTICRQSALCCRQITTPTPHHSIFTGRWRPTNS